MRLFYKEDFFDYTRIKKEQLKREIGELDKARVSVNDDEEILEYFLSKYKKEKIELLTEQIEVMQSEIEIDISKRRNAFSYVYDDSPFFVKALQLEFHIPFIGEKDLFIYRPSSYHTTSPEADTNGEELIITLSEPLEGNPAEAIQSRFDSELKSIESYINFLNKDIEKFNSELEPIIKTELEKRKSKLEIHDKVSSIIRYPIRKSNDINVANVKMKPILKRIKELRTEKSKPEFIMTEEVYSEILYLIKAMASTMEKSPSAFSDMDEESIRFHFLVNLNSIFEGDARGEIFNHKGKTDILITHKGKNIFISELKFWKGAESFKDTIEQILGYTAWRDTKTCIILLNKNKQLSKVLKQIPDLVKESMNYVGTESESETEFRYKFHHNNDKDKLLTLTVLVFEVPS
ncbi:MAG TPA: hypothetical protein VGA67_05460 [Candidatus Dojkabacteria bacterium]|jgi:hypothetical protein